VGLEVRPKSTVLPVELRSARREPSSLLKLDEDSEYLPNGFNLRHATAIDLKQSLELVLKETQVFITCHFVLKHKNTNLLPFLFYFLL